MVVVEERDLQMFAVERYVDILPVLKDGDSSSNGEELSALQKLLAKRAIDPQYSGGFLHRR